MATIEERTHNDGTQSYRVKIRRRGYPTISKTFARVTDAKRYIRKIESDIDAGKAIATPEATKRTLADAIDRYIKTELPRKPKSQQKLTMQLNWWKDQLGHLMLNQVTAPKIAECRDMLAEEFTVRGTKRSPATVNRYLAAISHMFTVAIKEWEWLEINPSNKVSKYKETRGRVRYLDESELNRLLTTCRNSNNQHLYPAVFLAIATGARRNEIMGLTYDDVDLKHRLITFRETKNNTIRSVPISDEAHQVLLNLMKVQRLDTKLLFPSKMYPNQPIDLRKPWEKALREAKIDDFVWHSLRHTTASYLAMNGATTAEIAEILGHKTYEMTKRYSHLSKGHIADIMGKMNKKTLGNAQKHASGSK